MPHHNANGTASFFPTWVYERSDNAFSLNMIMDPDEYVFPVNNSSYTNVIRTIALNFADEAAATPSQESRRR